MENLKIKATTSSPYISFDCVNHRLEIKGKSYPVNSEDFFMPVFTWLENYLDQLDSPVVTVNIELLYFNSSTAIMLAFFFEKLEMAVDDGKMIIINWCYEKDDEDSLESGEEFKEEFRRLPFRLVEKEITL